MSHISTSLLTTTRFGSGNEWFNQFPLVWGEIAGVCFDEWLSRMLYVVFTAYVLRAFLLTQLLLKRPLSHRLMR